MYWEYGRELLSMIYPKCCPVCGRIILPKGRVVCEQCKNSLQLIKEPRCKKCSKPINNETAEYCYDCQRKQYHYSYGISVWVYDKAMQKSIAAFKYKHKKEYADFYVDQILSHCKEVLDRMKLDLIVPVPIHKRRLKQRGYNQASTLAKGIAKGLGITWSDEILVRKVNTTPQKLLNPTDRLHNLRHAFSLKDEKRLQITSKKILLVDDIYTTGSTIEVCSQILIKAGAKEVYFVTICIGKGF